MPIDLSRPIRVITQDEFHAIDRVMLGQAFAIHNQYGRLLDETFDKAELAERCSRSGLAVATELFVRVRHGCFTKDYFIDLLLDESTITENKCVEALAPAHRGQALNYLLLAGTHHGSLVNFRPNRVQREFVSTQWTLDLRRRFTVSRHQWPDDTIHRKLVEVAVAFCADVGLAITALPALTEPRQHLQRLLDNTRLRGIAWVNLPLNELRFEFLRRQNHEG